MDNFEAIHHLPIIHFYSKENFPLYKFVRTRTLLSYNFSFENMKSKDLKNRVLSKYEDRQSYTKIYEDFHGSLGL